MFHCPSPRPGLSRARITVIIMAQWRCMGLTEHWHGACACVCGQAFRCYGGDVSRLVDLSRHSIVFEEPEQML
eukprot:1868402-Rhodomonas_salina.1